MSLLGLGAGLASAAVFGIAAVVQAGSVRGYDASSDRIHGFWLRAIRDLRMWAVVFAYYAGFVLHAVAIWLLPLYLAQALVSLSLPVASLAASRLDARLDAGRWLSVGLVSVGLILLALGAGEPGEFVSGSGFAVVLWVCVVALAVAWTLQNPNVSSAIIGASRPEQVTENVKAAGVVLESDVLAAIDEVLGEAVERDPAKTQSPQRRDFG